MTNLGVLYYHGDGVKQDRQKAVKLYRLAADCSDALAARAQMSLANALLDDGNLEESSAWVRRAAENGLTDAECAIGKCYVLGQGMPVDYTEAKKWLGRAAAKGDEEAIKCLRMAGW